MTLSRIVCMRSQGSGESDYIGVRGTGEEIGNGVEYRAGFVQGTALSMGIRVCVIPRLYEVDRPMSPNPPTVSRIIDRTICRTGFVDLWWRGFLRPPAPSGRLKLSSAVHRRWPGIPEHRHFRRMIGVIEAHWFATLRPPNRTCGSPASGPPVSACRFAD